MNKIISVKNKCIQTKEIAGFSFSDESFSQLKEQVIGKRLMASDSDEVKGWIGNITEVTSDGFKIGIINSEFEGIVWDEMIVSVHMQALCKGSEILEISGIDKITVSPSNKFNEVEIKKLEN